jgi:RHS repeat-associated protein
MAQDPFLPGQTPGFKVSVKPGTAQENRSSAQAVGGPTISTPRNDDGTIDETTLAGNTTDYVYTTDERELKKTVPAGRNADDPGVECFEYDAASRLDRYTDGEGRTRTYEYDDMDRLRFVRFGTGADCVGEDPDHGTPLSAYIEYRYDANGNRTFLHDDRGDTAWTYDLLNRALTESLNSAGVHAYAWDLAGNVTSHTEGGQTTTYGYDERDDAVSVTDPAGKQTLFSYHTDHQKLNRIRIEPSGPNSQAIVIDYDYYDENDGNNDGSGRLQSVKATAANGNVIEHFRYGYNDDPSDDGEGAQLEYVRDKSTDSCIDWDYDASLGRLTKARVTDDEDACHFADGDGNAAFTDRYEYDYDDASNMTQRRKDGSVTDDFAYNDRNELCWIASSASSNGCGSPPAGAAQATVDDAGGLTEIAGRYEIDYDQRGRTDTIQPDGSAAISQSYAGLGQSERVGAGDNAFRYGLPGLNLASNTTASTGEPLAQGQTRYVRMPDGRLVSQRKPDGATEYFIFDAHPGSVVALARADGTGSRACADPDTTNDAPVAARFRYDPYGRVISRCGPSDTPWRYAGAWFDRFPDSDPGVQQGLYKMGERYYDPRAGRWTQKDPLDQAGNLRESNRYAYVGGDPVNIRDPFGLYFGGETEACLAGGLVGGATGAATGAVAGVGIGAVPGSAGGAAIGCFTGVITYSFQQSDDPLVEVAGYALDLAGTVKDAGDFVKGLF